ncbi:MAG: hypothetical protein WBV62_01795, partial [Roseobacter sp.]
MTRVMKIIGIPAMIDAMKAQEASFPPKSVPHCSIRPRGILPAPKAIVPADRTTPRQNAYKRRNLTSTTPRTEVPRRLRTVLLHAREAGAKPQTVGSLDHFLLTAYLLHLRANRAPKTAHRSSQHIADTLQLIDCDVDLAAVGESTF